MAAHHDTERPPNNATWKPVPGWEGIFEASTTGAVRRVAPAVNTYVGRVLRPVVNHNGYLVVQLSARPRKYENRFLHRIIAETFIGPSPSPKHQINHIDGNKTNNSVANLEWVTAKENHEHASANALKSRGSSHPQSKLDEGQARQIRTLKGLLSSRQVGARFGVDQAIVLRIWKGILWKHA